MAHDGVAVLVEHRDLIIFADPALAALMLQHDYVVGFLLLHGHRDLFAFFAKGLDDLRRLRTSATMCFAAEAAAGTTRVAGNLPRLAVGHEDARLFLREQRRGKKTHCNED